jgi:hypothetical protein
MLAPSFIAADDMLRQGKRTMAAAAAIWRMFGPFR